MKKRTILHFIHVFLLLLGSIISQLSNNGLKILPKVAHLRYVGAQSENRRVKQGLSAPACFIQFHQIK